MACYGCSQHIDVVKTELQKAIELASLEAKKDNKLYYVIQSNGKYYSECADCRQKSGSTDGIIVAYVR